jgi:hypothetical protein
VTGIENFINMRDPSASEARTIWHNIAAVALECIGHYAWHAELGEQHSRAVQLVSQAMSHLDSAALALQLAPTMGVAPSAGEGLCKLFACVMALEESDALCRMPITKSMLFLIEKLFAAFEKHFGSAWSADHANMAAELHTCSKMSGFKEARPPKINPSATNATVTLAKIEDACQEPTKVQRNEWKTMGMTVAGDVCVPDGAICV